MEHPALNTIQDFVKVFFGFGNVEDGSICRVSKLIWDLHDYPIKKGGDGTPSHFHTYNCHRCSKRFRI